MALMYLDSSLIRKLEMKDYREIILKSSMLNLRNGEIFDAVLAYDEVDFL